MTWVVLLRAANVGGRFFRPLALVEALPALRLESVGAAGTFLARTGLGATAVRAAVRSGLPFEASVMIVDDAAVRRLLDRDPAASAAREPGTRKFVTVADRPFPSDASLPLEVPPTPDWQVRVIAFEGPFAVGVHRRTSSRLIYPNAVLERSFPLRATTRWWETLEEVGERLARTPSGSVPRPKRSRPAASSKRPRR